MLRFVLLFLLASLTLVAAGLTERQTADELDISMLETELALAQGTYTSLYGSCYNMCGGQSNGNCYCCPRCVKYYVCCDDYWTYCPPTTEPPTTEPPTTKPPTTEPPTTKPPTTEPPTTKPPTTEPPTTEPPTTKPPVVSGDPHMRTFDGRPYTFMGLCWYTLFKDCTPKHAFEVTAKFGPRADSTPENIRTRTVAINITVGGESAYIDGLDVITNIAGSATAKREIQIQQDGNMFLASFTSKQTTFTIKWTLKKHVVDTSIIGTDYEGKLCGMLGNADGNVHNDFRKPDGTPAHTVDEFGYSWKVEGKECDFM
ncbi:BMP-binding endothelial regulator protein-like [Saccoglossus kowalevskii]|uniref:Hemocytin-like isoform X2 n=1 Tax=Saccoglossus kowalevskii TaxID=10224 RepID=A0ABM0MRG8_SACKO|nr:PREDICTED: hemocytin-like isoform X2 [Saccoglossus kowalevskii]